MTLMKKLLKRHSNPEGIQELAVELEKRKNRIEELEDTVTEFQDFLKHNPDVKELHDLRCELADRSQRNHELEEWIRLNRERDVKIEKERIMELEEMLTHLEDYVKEHNVDVLKQKLKDREDRIDQLQERVDTLEKESMKNEGKMKHKRESKIDHRDFGTMVESDFEEYACIKRELIEKEHKMKEMEHALSEKDNRIQEYEQQVVEWQDKLNKFKKEMDKLEKELGEYEAEDIGVLKEEIRVRDEKVVQLEEEIDSLERAFNERIDLEQIEELVGLVKEKEDREKELETDLMKKMSKIEELSEALKESVIITTEGEKKLKTEMESRKSALERIGKLEQRIASMQTVSALKCPTCRPLLTKLQNSEKRLERLAEERTTQLEDLHQIKRGALKTAVSEKDAHLALLELSGLKTAVQIEQAEKLKADRKMLLEKLKEEDERSIEFLAESSSSNFEAAPQSLQKILEPIEEVDRDVFDNNHVENEEMIFDKDQCMNSGKKEAKPMKIVIRKVAASTNSEKAKDSR